MNLIIALILTLFATVNSFTATTITTTIKRIHINPNLALSRNPNKLRNNLRLYNNNENNKPNDPKPKTFIPSLAYPLLLFDTFLLLNLSLSLSFHVTHTFNLLNFTNFPSALNSASLLSISWILACIYNEFYHPPNAKDLDNVGRRTCNTWVSFTTLILIEALGEAVFKGEAVGSLFLCQELGFTLILMNIWRYLYAIN
ncbi:hypothetical protein TrLO_g15661 [Triparma laevis f. longispina]|uniref:Uncharacterized protein n=1 Tax=Triparma laevis f. longispina TaxID=1714387 RepID=A0A9W7FUP8_9STRA|nr:hypothetical protein TrLO_g15661 [Triparma laevis f. longispina]